MPWSNGPFSTIADEGPRTETSYLVLLLCYDKLLKFNCYMIFVAHIISALVHTWNLADVVYELEATSCWMLLPPIPCTFTHAGIRKTNEVTHAWLPYMNCSCYYSKYWASIQNPCMSSLKNRNTQYNWHAHVKLYLEGIEMMRSRTIIILFTYGYSPLRTIEYTVLLRIK